MLSLILAILFMFWFGKFLVWIFKATWSVGKVVFSIIFFPIMVGILVATGLMYVVIITAIVGFVVIFVKELMNK